MAKRRRVSVGSGAALLVLGALAVTACNLVFGIDERQYDPSLDVDGGRSEAGPIEAGPDAPFVIGQPSCLGLPAPLDQGACHLFERLDASVVLDGIADEYCNLHATTYLVTNGHKVVPLPRKPYPEAVRMFAAWTQEGIAMHVHVDDPVVIGESPPSNGDSLTFYLGSFLKKSMNPLGFKQAVVVTVSPPTATEPAHAVIAKDGMTPTYPGAVARQVLGGYEVEILVTWLDLGIQSAPSPSNRDQLFDLAVSVLDSLDAGVGGGPELVSFFEDQTPSPDSGGTPCADHDPNPTCDTRTWCEAQLQP